MEVVGSYILMAIYTKVCSYKTRDTGRVPCYTRMVGSIEEAGRMIYIMVEGYTRSKAVLTHS
jgi:hypothetical protein